MTSATTGPLEPLKEKSYVLDEGEFALRVQARASKQMSPVLMRKVTAGMGNFVDEDIKKDLERIRLKTPVSIDSMDKICKRFPEEWREYRIAYEKAEAEELSLIKSTAVQAVQGEGGAADRAAAPSKKLSGTSRECANCCADENMFRTPFKACARCGLVFYCSKNCQSQHWKAIAGHKKYCLPKSSRAPSMSGAESCVKIEGDIVCSICQDTLHASSVNLCTLACSHSFHEECVEGIRIYGISQVCPNCRVPLTGKMKEFDEFTRTLFTLKNRL